MLHAPPLPPPASSLRYKRRSFAWTGVTAPPAQTPPARSAAVALLGVRLADPSRGEMLWEQTLSAHELTFLRDHRVGRVSLLPGSCYIVMAKAVAKEQYGAKAFALTQMKFSAIMFLDDVLEGAPTVRVSLSRGTGV
eukprot:2939530-Pleurochrysis_carterae.AAC.1